MKTNGFWNTVAIAALIMGCGPWTGCTVLGITYPPAPQTEDSSVKWQVYHKPGVSEIAWSAAVTNHTDYPSYALIIDCLNAQGEIRAEDGVGCRLQPGETILMNGVMDVPTTEISGITRVVVYLSSSK